jgi:hypothetical protein
MEADVTAGLASLILQSQAPITIVLAALFSSANACDLLQGAGIALACAGLALFGLAGGGQRHAPRPDAGADRRAVLVLRQPRPARLPGVNMTALFIWASLVPPLPMLGLSLAAEGPAPFATIAALSLQGWLAVAYVAFISTVLGFSIWGALLSRHPAATITPFALLIPVVGLSVAALVLGETVTRRRGRRRARRARRPRPRRSSAENDGRDDASGPVHRAARGHTGGATGGGRMDRIDDQGLVTTGLQPEGTGRILLVACGALAREVLALKEANGWTHMDLQCLPAILHNHPEKIPDAVERAVTRGARSLRQYLRPLRRLRHRRPVAGPLRRARGGDAGRPPLLQLLRRQRRLRRP